MKNSVIKSALRLLWPGLAFVPSGSAELTPKPWALSNGSIWIILPIVLFFLFSYASAQQNQSEVKDAEAYTNRGRAYYLKGEYDKSWEDIKKAQDLGYKIPPKFLDDLRKASGKQN